MVLYIKGKNTNAKNKLVVFRQFFSAKHDRHSFWMKNWKEESANDAMLQIRHLQLIQSSYITVFRNNPAIIIYGKGTLK